LNPNRRGPPPPPPQSIRLSFEAALDRVTYLS
jgi:hypothetical protein